MSNRTKIKQRSPKSEKIAAPAPRQPKKLWQPPQTLLAAVVFLGLGAAIFGKSLYVVIPAGVILIAILGWSGLAAHYSSADSRGSRALRSMLMPSILIVIMIIVRVLTLLGN